MTRLSGWRRLSITLTAIWVVAVAALQGIGLFSFQSYPYDRLIVFGIVPPALLWTFWWVWRGFRKPG